jgi:hypothetical protein
LGLDAEDLILVEDYAEMLRSGTVSTANIFSSRPILPQGDNLLVYLESNFAELIALKERLEETEVY